MKLDCSGSDATSGATDVGPSSSEPPCQTPSKQKRNPILNASFAARLKGACTGLASESDHATCTTASPASSNSSGSGLIRRSRSRSRGRRASGEEQQQQDRQRSVSRNRDRSRSRARSRSRGRFGFGCHNEDSVQQTPNATPSRKRATMRSVGNDIFQALQAQLHAGSATPLLGSPTVAAKKEPVKIRVRATYKLPEGLAPTPSRKKKGTLQRGSVSHENLDVIFGKPEAVSGKARCNSDGYVDAPMSPPTTTELDSSTASSSNSRLKRISVGQISSLIRNSLTDSNHQRNHHSSGSLDYTDEAAATDPLQSLSYHSRHSRASSNGTCASEWGEEDDCVMALNEIQQEIVNQHDKRAEIEQMIERSTQFVGARLESNNRIGVLVSMKQIFKFETVLQGAILATTLLKELETQVKDCNDAAFAADYQQRIDEILKEATTTPRASDNNRLTEQEIMDMARERVAAAASNASSSNED